MLRFTIACAQMASRPLEPEDNVQRAISWIERATLENGAQLIVLPEACTTGFVPGVSAETLWDMIDTIPGRLTALVCQAAQRLGIYVVFPTYERGPQRGVVYNSAALIGPAGQVIGVYRKTHLFPTERLAAGGWSSSGREAPVFHTPLGSIGIMICYDGDFPELARVMAIRGAEVLVRPSALTRSYEIWELTNRARAYDNLVYVAGCNAVGPDAGGNYYFGHSMIVSPISQKLALARGSEEVIAAELDPDPIKFLTYGAKTPMLFDHLEDRNLEAYQGILQPARGRFEPARRL